MRVAVVGHVEWVEFVRVPQVPPAGSIVLAREVWAEPAGGGGVAAVRLSRLAGNALFVTAVGNDDIGGRAVDGLRGRGVRVEAAIRDEPQRRAFTYVDDDGERTITVLSHKLVAHGDDELPWHELAEYDAAYFTGGDVDALRRARQARVLVATSRELATLREAGVQLDALVGSASDEGEAYEDGDLDPPPLTVVRTDGKAGGSYEHEGRSGRYTAAPLPGPLADTYGAGDSFAAGLTYALGARMPIEEALAFAAAQGAEAMTRRGAHGA